MPNDDQLGRICVGRYRLGRVLGSGAHGRVHIADDLGRGGLQVAFKIVEGLVGGTRREPADEKLRWFRHPNWAAVLDAGVIREDARFQALEYVDGQSLDRIEGPQPVSDVWRFLEQGARVLGALHRLGLIHYDVTPGNWIRSGSGDDVRFVLTDGGLAHVGPVSGFARGTPRFMAPEVTESGGHDHRADLYSLGLVAFRMATGRDAIEGHGADVLGRRRREGAPRASSMRSDLPGSLDDLLADLLARDPQARPHDAAALLERIATGEGRSVPQISEQEGVAAAGAGPLAGRASALERCATSMVALSQRMPVPGGPRRNRQAHPIADAVLVLAGAPGAGCTRLAREMASRARDEDLPVLTMTGCEGAADRRDPLRHLVDGLVTLGVAAGENVDTVRLELADSETLGPDARAHAVGRAAEQFLRAVEAAARRTPFVLVIEDFADLPERAREAVMVLSRDLLSRRESAGGATALPVLLVVDAGSSAFETLLIPDASDPERPLVHVESLGRDEVTALCEARFPGSMAEAADVDRVLQVSEGLPGALAALMGEGCRRGDLRAEGGRWLWNVDSLADYRIERGLTPLQADALRRADPATLHLLQLLSLVDAPLTADVLETALDRQLTWNDRVNSPLLAVAWRGGVEQWAVAGGALRNLIQARLDSNSRSLLQRRLTAALVSAPHGELTLLRARLHTALGAHADAVAVLLAGWACLSTDVRVAAQETLGLAIERVPSMLDAPLARARLSASMLPATCGAAAALLLAERLTPGADAPLVALRTVDLLESSRQHAPALHVLERFLQDESMPLADAAAMWTRCASLRYDAQQESLASAALTRARDCLRRARRNEASRPTTATHYLMARARQYFLIRQTSRAVLCLRGALRMAKGRHLTPLRVRALNNLGIVAQQAEDLDGARAYFERSLRLRRLLGDVDGIVKTTTNLGRLAQISGALVRSASLYQEAARVALRHAQHAPLSTALRELARVYDQQLNARLATATLLRATQVGQRVSHVLGVSLAARELAPLAAATGDHALARSMLILSGRAARTRTTDGARATHELVSALAQMHMGNRRKARVHALRLRRHRDQLQPGQHATATIIGALLASPIDHAEPAEGRLARLGTDRFLYRAHIWALRATRTDREAPTLPLARFAPRLGQRRSASGTARRLLVEAALQVVQRPRSHGVTHGVNRLIQNLESHLAHTGESRLQARAQALWSITAGPTGSAACALRFSRAVDLLGATTPAGRTPCTVVPHEHWLASRAHLAGTADAHNCASTTHSDLHALAHQLLVRNGSTAAPDTRVAAALRRVLEATGRLNAGATLDEMLDALTNNTVEITGAERACVVLLEPGGGLRVRVARNSPDAQQVFALEDLSHTVVQRVLASAQPLLLHDVFDDQELMGRPSITSLSLRSILCVPMLRSEALYGVMYADSASAAGSFDQVDLEVLSLFAEQAAAALETHRLVADLHNSMAELKAMQERLVRGERLRTIGELSSGVAHEFNNLLTAILARVQLLGLTRVDLELKHELDIIERACLDAAEVVRRLQSYARHQRQENFSTVDIGEICRDSVEFLRPLWTTRRRHGRDPVRVQLQVASRLLVRGNPTELREVVTNLLKNALDAMPGGGAITVSAARAQESVVVEVADNGPGIPEAIQPKVFDPFFTTKGERGTGLGLCLSQQIVERHAGQISLKSIPGTGTTLTVRLPPDPGSPHLSGSNGIESASSQAEHAATVLVVDDDEHVLVPLCRFLERLGYRVVSSSDGVGALDLASAAKPDVVLSDVGMPGMDGLALCRALGSSLPGVPVVLMSGWADCADAPRAYDAGAVALLAKPFALQEVADTITALLVRRVQQ